MGFSYRDWSGPFYPSEMSPRGYLAYYSRVFNAVEIDSTFYGIPKLETVQRWAAAVPDSFQFCLKAPRIITHDLVLTNAMGLMQEFIETARGLGEKLGVVLLQFPPSFTVDQFQNLESFLSELPDSTRFAVEVRDLSWYTAEAQMAAMLAAHGVCWAATEYPGLPRHVQPTAGFFYIRWIGQHGSFPHHDHERIDRTPQLRVWWERLRAELNQVQTLYGFFNNDYAGFAPATANKFKNLVGLPVESIRPPQQGTLF